MACICGTPDARSFSLCTYKYIYLYVYNNRFIFNKLYNTMQAVTTNGKS